MPAELEPVFAGASTEAAASQPRLLFISPVIPSLTGNGLAMRAGTTLRLFARRYRVSLLIFPLYAAPQPHVPESLAGLCERVAITGGTGCEHALKAQTFDVVHVFRLSALAHAQPLLEGTSATRPRRCLDIDDVESVTSQRLAALYRLNGDATAAAAAEREAQVWAETERQALSMVDRVYVCSDGDADAIRARSSVEVVVLPNSLDIPPPIPAPRRNRPFTFVFLGTLGYYPNADGALWFCNEVLPLLERATADGIQLIVAGLGAPESVRRLGSRPHVALAGWQPDVADLYRAADAVVVPIRAGGGTRIKLLEAFSYCRPAVSTTVGCEGLDVKNERDLLVADTPEAFAAACLRLAENGDLAERLAQTAFERFVLSYSTEAVARALG
jgi:polysaccharide biosynthesis protein PslH